MPIGGFADDYAFLVRALLDLYEATLEAEWMAWAAELQQRQDQLFWDQDGGEDYDINFHTLETAYMYPFVSEEIYLAS